MVSNFIILGNVTVKEERSTTNNNSGRKAETNMNMKM